jgi:hypothetical protein
MYCATPLPLTCCGRGTTSAPFQELLGHSDVKTTTIHTYMLDRHGRGVRSPLDQW